MLEQAMQYLAKLAERAAGPVKIGADRSDSCEYWIDGAVHTFRREPTAMQHRFDRLSGLVEFLHAEGCGEQGDEAHCWITPTKVVAFKVDRSDVHTYGRRNACIERVSAGGAAAVAGLCAAPSFEHRALLRFLRFELPNTPTAFLAAMRRLDFSRKSAGASSVEHGRESLGRSVELTVQGAAEIPESFIVHGRMSSNPDLGDARFSVEVHVVLDLEGAKITLLVRRDEWEEQVAGADVLAEAAVRDALPPNVRVFRGTPRLV